MVYCRAGVILGCVNPDSDRMRHGSGIHRNRARLLTSTLTVRVFRVVTGDTYRHYMALGEPLTCAQLRATVQKRSAGRGGAGQSRSTDTRKVSCRMTLSAARASSR